MSNENLAALLRRLGASISVIETATWSDLRKSVGRNRVAIVSWMLNGYIGHFSVVTRVTSTHVILADPALGRTRSMRRIVFLRLWYDYRGDRWYPRSADDIRLRWLCVATVT